MKHIIEPETGLKASFFHKQYASYVIKAIKRKSVKDGLRTKEDWEKLQNHPNVGVNLLMNINFLSEVVPYIHYHKERWDGLGEPEGLKGHSIPLGSRIIAVADAFSAMTADRPYRKAMLKRQAFDEVKKESDSKWDPEIIDALDSIITPL